MMLKSRLLPFQQNARNCRKRRRTGWSSRQSWTTAWSASSSAGTATCSRDTTRPSASSATGPAWLPGAKKVILKTFFLKKNGQILASFCIFSSFSQDKFKKYNWGNSSFNFCLLYTVIAIWRGLFGWNGRATNWAKETGKLNWLEWQGKNISSKETTRGH